ncbi:amino acid adenylation domain-containing protein [Pseudosporangium ferrugineum]|nr:amino acid adenylation domain-containing protein [Pseudosporangium ferrugineum]
MVGAALPWTNTPTCILVKSRQDPGGRLIHENLAIWAAQDPGRPAVHWRGSTYSYAEIDAIAEDTRAAVSKMGLPPRSAVGVCMARSPTLIGVLHGILRAGCFYVPLDPAYPPDRTAYMLADSGARVVFEDDEPGQPRLRSATGGEVLTTTVTQPPPARDTTDAEPAYVIYTSGSTGRPKGVLIGHGSARALADWAAGTFAADMDGVLASTSICFDLSIFEIFGTFAGGGRLVLVDNVLDLVSLDETAGARLVNSVPSAVREVIDSGALPRSVRTVCLAGERFPATLAEALWRLPEVTRVCNLYGPSEDTTYSTWADLVPGAPGEPPIGHPLPGTRGYVLNHDLRATTDGEPGELYLSGDGLALGYLGRPSDTAAAFLPDPFVGTPGARMYRTGDRVRRRADGVLEYIGRSDDQVKVRGFRIELGEVSAALHRVPGVRTACATVVTGPSGDLRLAGYLVADRPGATDDAAVLAHLRTFLPSAMVPTLLVWCDRLPVTPSGKIDRAALPPPRYVAEAPAEGGDPVEAAVGRVWRELLCTVPAPDSDFFADGGDSLTALRFAARVGAAIGRSVPYTLLLEHPTLAAATASIRSAPPAAAEDDPADDDHIAPLSGAQRRLWVLQEMDPQDTAYLINVVVEVDGVGTVAELTDALDRLARRHTALRTAFVAGPTGEPAQLVAPAPARRPRVEQIGPADDFAERAARLAAADSARSIPLARPGPWRAGILAKDDVPVALVLTLHHIIFDGWSLAILVNDLGQLLSGEDGGELPGGIAASARRWTARARTEAAITAAERLASSVRDAPAVLDLPADRTDGEAEGNDAVQYRRTLDPELATAVRAAGQAQGATLYMVGLAAFGVALGGWCGRDDLLIGSAFSGRTDVADEPHVGCFVNMVPVRVRFDRADPCSKLVARVRDSALFATRHQDVSFEQLVERVRPVRVPGRNPLYQVAFGVQADARPVYAQGGVRLRGREVPAAKARLDLTLWLEADGDAIEAVWTAPARRFRREGIAHLHRRFETVLRSTAHDPEQTIAAVQAAAATRQPIARRRRNG